MIEPDWQSHTVHVDADGPDPLVETALWLKNHGAVGTYVARVLSALGCVTDFCAQLGDIGLNILVLLLSYASGWEIDVYAALSVSAKLGCRASATLSAEE
jgi:hypothetical protein